MFDNAKDSGVRLPKPLKTYQRLIKSHLANPQKASKVAQRRKKRERTPPQSCFTNKQFLIRYLNEG